MIKVDNGYSIKARRGKIKIYPVGNTESMKYTIGLGNATITLRVREKTKFIRQIITGEAQGDYMPDFSYGYSRGAKTADGVVDSDYNVNNNILTVKQFNGFSDTSNEVPMTVKTHLTKTVSNGGLGRVIW